MGHFIFAQGTDHNGFIAMLQVGVQSPKTAVFSLSQRNQDLRRPSSTHPMALELGVFLLGVFLIGTVGGNPHGRRHQALQRGMFNKERMIPSERYKQEWKNGDPAPIMPQYSSDTPTSLYTPRSCISCHPKQKIYFLSAGVLLLLIVLLFLSSAECSSALMGQAKQTNCH
jgi:hypothetical protein